MVDWWNAALRTLIGGFGSLFGELHPFVGLTVLSVLVGVGMLWVFARVSNQDAIRRTKKRLQAYLLELRLFGDEPALLWKSQKDLLRTNVHYLSLMLRPALILTAPVVILLFHLDAIYGLAPLPVGEPAVVTVQASGQISSRTPAPRLAADPGFAVETPAVRVLEQSQFSWRIRPLKEALKPPASCVSTGTGLNGRRRSPRERVPRIYRAAGFGLGSIRSGIPAKTGFEGPTSNGSRSATQRRRLRSPVSRSIG